MSNQDLIIEASSIVLSFYFF